MPARVAPRLASGLSRAGRPLLGVALTLTTLFAGQLPFLDLPRIVTAPAALAVLLVFLWSTRPGPSSPTSTQRPETGARYLAATVALGLAAQLSHGFDLTIPGRASSGTFWLEPNELAHMLGALALGAAILSSLYYLIFEGRVGLALLAATLGTFVVSGPRSSDRLSLMLNFPASFSLPRSLLHSSLVVALIGVAIAIVAAPGEASQRQATRAMERTLAVAVAIQLAIGVSLRSHVQLHWVHILFALAVVVPLSVRLCLRALLALDETTPRRILPVALGVTVTGQLGLGLLAFVIPIRMSFENATAMIDLLVTMSHFAIAMVLFTISLVWAFGPQHTVFDSIADEENEPGGAT